MRKWQDETRRKMADMGKDAAGASRSKTTVLGTTGTHLAKRRSKHPKKQQTGHHNKGEKGMRQSNRGNPHADQHQPTPRHRRSSTQQMSKRKEKESLQVHRQTTSGICKLVLNASESLFFFLVPRPKPPCAPSPTRTLRESRSTKADTPMPNAVPHFRPLTHVNVLRH